MKDTSRLLRDMLEAIEAIESYAVLSYDAFMEDEKTQDAIMFNLVIIGEAANQLSSKFREKHPEIPWTSIIGTRNVIVHGYAQVRLQIVWDIIQKDLGALKVNLARLI